VVPEDFARRLRDWRTAGNYFVLAAVLHRAVEQGWPAAALARALGVSRQAVGHHVANAPVLRRLPVQVPAVPPRPVPEPKPRAEPVHLDPAVAERLRVLAETARTVNGAMPADHAARHDSVLLSFLLAQERGRGVSVAELAKTVGMTTVGVRKRLARHGYTDLAPSEVHIAYKGRSRWDPPAAAQAA
jgi:biotin operon repressor